MAESLRTWEWKNHHRLRRMLRQAAEAEAAAEAAAAEKAAQRPPQDPPWIDFVDPCGLVRYWYASGSR